MTVTTTAVIDQRTNTYAEIEMLAWAQATVVLGKFGMTKPLPANKADNVTFRRLVPFAAATTPLTEGVTPTAQQFTYEDVTATMQQFGVLVEFTDWVTNLVEDSAFNDCLKAVADQMAQTIEAVTWGVVKAGTNVYRANGAARTDINTPIDQTQQRAITRFLNAQKAKKISRIQDASPNYQTRAVWAAYAGISHTDMEHDLLEMPSFTPVAEYGSRQTLCEEEVGSCENVRYVLSADLDPWADAGGTYNAVVDTVSTTGASSDVYPVLITGKDAYGVVPLKGKAACEPVMIPTSQRDKSDPLGQRGYVGALHYFTAVRLNETWMARAECAATAIS